MKTVRYYGIQDIRFEEQPMPVCGEDEVLIHIEYAGICGSDMHIYNKGMFIQNIPETMGHEFSGIIEQTGAGVKDFSPGDIVIADPMVPCMKCSSCLEGSYNTCTDLGFIGEVRQGCFAEYICMKSDKLIKAPAGTDTKKLALAEPLAVALNVCEQAQLSPDDNIAVIGAGPIGLLTAAAAFSLYGLKEVTIVNRSAPRREIASELGIPHVYSRLPDDAAFSKVIEAAGGEGSFSTALAHTAHNGSLYIVSIFEDNFVIDINTIVASQISLIGCNVYKRKHLENAVDAIASGKIDVSALISAEFPLEKCSEAFTLMSSKKTAKILFRPE